MEFRIADSFTSGLARLTAEEQKAVKTTAFDLQLNPASPGMQFHRLDKSKDKNFWSIRVSSDIRIIVHKSEASLLLCYVDHHDRAYQWAERRKLETHPKTGAAQLVEIRERVEEIIIPHYITVDAPAPAPKPALTKPLIFAAYTQSDLLGFGVPAEWIEDVQKANEDSLLALTDHLPSEASEALLELATGGTPSVTVALQKGADPFAHPDAQRRFRVLRNVEELEAAFANPWEKWILFLHPSQKNLVDREYTGPARVSGSAGTGKTIVALHRAVALTRRHPDARVLLTTFSPTLANALRARLLRLLVSEPQLGERLEVHDLNAIGRRLYELNIARTEIADTVTLNKSLQQASANVAGHKFSEHFLRAEWDQVVDAWQLKDWESYRDVKRLGRKTRLPEKQRILLWSLFDWVHKDLKTKNRVTYSEMFSQLADKLSISGKPSFDFVVVDESQDIQVAQLRYLATLGKNRPDSLFFAGDLGQRIFQSPFSWKGLGVDIRGRSTTLKVNYRTSHQIRTYADRLLGPEVSDVDGIGEQRKGTVSVFNGPNPDIRVFASPQAEIMAVSQWLRERALEGYKAHEIGVFVRSEAELERAQEAVGTSGYQFRVLDTHLDILNGHVSIGTMHMAKGLEFRAVAVMACDDEVVPLQSRIETVTDDTDLLEVYETERHLLYVACTRARDQLLVTSGGDPSEFLADMQCYPAKS